MVTVKGKPEQRRNKNEENYVGNGRSDRNGGFYCS